MKKSAFTQKVVVSLFFLSAAWCVAEDATNEVPAAPRPVVVEVFGYAAPDKDQPVAAVHREATEDALKNAVLQAHISLDVKVQTDGMRLKERQLRLRSEGSVEHSRVIEAGFMPNSDPPIYRVHMEVSVLPLSSVPATTPLPAQVALIITSTHGKPFQEALSASLQKSGIQVVEAENEPAALIAKVMLTGSTNQVVSELRWEMRRETLFSSTEPYEATVLRGEWLMPDGHPFSSLEMDKLAAMIAQDALHLWISPQGEL